MTIISQSAIEAVIFDFGGVLAEEGFREGLMAIARSNGLDPEDFFDAATRAVYESGYLTGESSERDYWNLLRRRTGINGSDESLRKEIMDRFVLRTWMLEIVRKLRGWKLSTAILSDQTQWLDELDAAFGFFKEFDRVFNSYHLGKSKRDPTIFTDVAEALGISPARILFVDDNEGHVQRARSQGLRAILFVDAGGFTKEMEEMGLNVG